MLTWVYYCFVGYPLDSQPFDSLTYLQCITCEVYTCQQKYFYNNKHNYRFSVAVLQAKKRPNENFEEVPSAKRTSESYNEGLIQL